MQLDASPLDVVAVLAMLAVIAMVYREMARHREMARQARHDDLTGLVGAGLFREHVAAAVADPARMPFVLFLDLDGFKGVNDTLGHDVGDDLLRAVAARLLESTRQGDTVARLGGDEFAILLPHVTDATDVGGIGRSIVEAFKHPYRVGSRSLFVGTSVGIAGQADMADLGDASADEIAATLIQRADMAMYRAKRSRSRAVVRWSDQLRLRSEVQLALQAHFHHAIDADQIVARLRPRRRMTAAGIGDLVGEELRVDWRHPQMGTIPGPVFAPLAGPSRWRLLEVALRQAETHLREADPDGDLVVGVPLRSDAPLAPPTIIGAVASGLRGRQHLAPRLRIELPMQHLPSRRGELTELVAGLRELGTRVGVRGVGGVGGPALLDLAEQHLDTLVLDRVLLRVDSEHPRAVALTEGLLALTRHLGVPVVFTGVDDPQTLERLATMELPGDGIVLQGSVIGWPADSAVGSSAAELNDTPAADPDTITSVRALVRDEPLPPEQVERLRQLLDTDLPPVDLPLRPGPRRDGEERRR